MTGWLHDPSGVELLLTITIGIIAIWLIAESLFGKK